MWRSVSAGLAQSPLGAKPATRQHSKTAGKAQNPPGFKGRVRVIRHGRGPMVAESPSPGMGTSAAGKGFWRQGALGMPSDPERNEEAAGPCLPGSPRCHVDGSQRDAVVR